MTSHFFGYVYLLESNGFYKIGYSFEPKTRLKRLQTGSPTPIRMIHTIRTAHYQRVEEKLHMDFAQKRVRGEWFALTNDDVARIKTMDNYGQTPEENAERDAREAAFRARPRTDKEIEQAAHFNMMMHGLFNTIARDIPMEPRMKVIRHGESET